MTTRAFLAAHAAHAALAMPALLAVAGSCPGADGQQPLLDQAREQQLAHQPRQAIELYRRAIDADRFDLERAAPALVELVACYRMLKDEPGIAGEYRADATKYLSHPPRLDGSGGLALDDAREDLLWKPWTAASGQESAVMTFAVDSANRRSAVGAGGVTGSQLQIVLMATPSPGMPIQMAMTSFDQDCGNAAATLADGSAHAATQVTVMNANGAIDAFLTFTDIPATVSKLKRLAGEIAITQRKAWEDRRVPLREGERIGTKPTDWQIVAVNSQAQLTVRLARARVTTAEELSHQLSTAAVATAGSSAGGNSGAQDGAVFWLVDEGGRRYDAQASGMSSDNRNESITLNFGAVAKPSTLVNRVVTATSTRKMRFSLDGVDVP
jgi:hypothetical protein